jgi:CMP-N-acetylneuraminic acid synthetase
MTIAIVPARKGSVRCPGKNTALVGGVSLVQRTIDVLLRTSRFDSIFITTDDPIILDQNFPHPVILLKRLSKLSTSDVPIIDVIRHVITDQSIPFQTTVAVIPVTNPLKSVDDIIGGLDLFENSDKLNSVLSVCKLDHPIELTWRMNGTLLSCNFDLTTTRKQDFPDTYKWNDAFIIDKSTNYLNHDRTLYGSTPLPYHMPPERSLYIDYPWQLKIVKELFN